MIRRLTAAAVLGLGLLSGCSFFGTQFGGAFRTASQTASQIVVQNDYGIICTRPEPGMYGFYFLKLREPALLTASVRPTADQVAELTKHQDDVIALLTALSAEIKVIFRYRFVVNAVAIVAPVALEDKLGALTGVAHVESTAIFDRPIVAAAALVANPVLQQRNSVKFIGGDFAKAHGLTGKGMRVGIIDTGIDYTHLMFGGDGRADTYKAIKPGDASPLFPTKKVVGGFDFAGTKFNSASSDLSSQIPMPDPNPLDEGGHGSHVAGTVAGRGDGVNTYDGVAPDAELYALKVFGEDGSTSDSVVIAAMEYAADPNGDGDVLDRLDVVNLSLGSGYGDAHILYTEAVKNLTSSGTAVVCSGGNSGDAPFIVGAPGVADEAVSVAASIDDMDQNWQFRAAGFSTVEEPEFFVQVVEGAKTKPLADLTSVMGKLVSVGLADRDFSSDESTALVGAIALVDRGGVSFSEKIARCQKAGAIGVVIANNRAEEPFVMGGSEGEKFEIPGVMIDQATGAKLKSALAKGTVTADLTTSYKIQRPELIDTIADFSSRGPRSVDGLLKPEIAAPGAKIISAKMGGGAAGVEMSGTSMSSPHMAGVMALLRQNFPLLSVQELKSIAMSTARHLVGLDKKPYSVSRQGSGRIQLERALQQTVVTEPAAVALGVQSLETEKLIQRQLKIKNLRSETALFKLELQGASTGLSLLPIPDVSVGGSGENSIALRFRLSAVGELDGVLVLKTVDGSEVARIPVIAITRSVARTEVESLTVHSSSSIDSQGAVVDLKLRNKSKRDGRALPFIHLARDLRKPDPTLDSYRSKVCDLAAVGYRVVSRSGETVVQFAVKLYEPLTTWDLCDISVLVDRDGDRLADQELVGTKQDHVEGLKEKIFSSVLLDAGAARQIRRTFDSEIVKPREPQEKEPVLDFSKAVLGLYPMSAFENSSVAIVEAPLGDLGLRSDGGIAVRIATTAQTASAIQGDDFFSNDPKKWLALSVAPLGPAFIDLPEAVSVKAGTQETVSFTKGAENRPLLLLYPEGATALGALGLDRQAEIVRPVFRP